MRCDCCDTHRGEYRLRVPLIVFDWRGVALMHDGDLICYQCYHYSDVWTEEPCGPTP